jgi:heat shock protein HtpX
MISALRKIEGRSDIPSANSAVMEMCIDDPRTGFASLFATHPSVDQRVAALVQFAGGHDPGPLAITPPQDGGQPEDATPEKIPYGPWNQAASEDPPSGPWGPRAG